MTHNAKYDPDLVVVIAAEDPGRIMEAIDGLSHLANLGFEDIQRQTVHGESLDTLDLALRRNQLELHVVRVESHERIRLISTPTDGGAENLVELPSPAQPQAFAALLERLQGYGMRATLSAVPTPAGVDARESLKRQGFLTLLSFDIQRTVKGVVSFNERGHRIKTYVALNRVTYHLIGRDLVHRELAFRYRTPDAPFAVETIVRMLRDLNLGPLREWKHSRVATGRAIQALWEEHALQDVIRDGDLQPQAYDRIEARLH
jgi:hypothetical protein